MIGKRTNVSRAIWLALPSLAKWALLGLGRRPSTITLGDLRAMRIRVRGLP